MLSERSLLPFVLWCRERRLGCLTVRTECCLILFEAAGASGVGAHMTSQLADVPASVNYTVDVKLTKGANSEFIFGAGEVTEEAHI
jgi:hypothetical protein